MTLRWCASVAALMIPFAARADVMVLGAPSAALGRPARIVALGRDSLALSPLPPLFAPSGEAPVREIRDAESDAGVSAEDFTTVLRLSLVFPRIDGDDAPAPRSPLENWDPIHTVAARDEGAIISWPTNGHRDTRLGEHALSGARTVSVSYFSSSAAH